MIVTTSSSPDTAIIHDAQRLADELGARYAERGSHSLKRLGTRHKDEQILVVSGHDVRYYDGQEPPLFFHPSMAFVRVKRLLRGETDLMLEVSGCVEGDEVLDCTAGLASDSFVFSYAVGPQGRVTALESEPVLAALVREGLLRYDTGMTDANEAMRNIEVVCQNHETLLSSLDDDSYDIVYFDPMFRQPIHASNSLAPLRQLANHSPLSPASVAEARRVARKAVVIKEHRGSGEFDRLGFEKRSVNTSKIAYGVIKI
ncbi:class I SAM-dependent methyltransferase [Paenibacillus sp. GCM10012307]|uniref:Class I SAM-dependent methyltransferase n=1 Tax=Paenibacillus roseus TaxID=2798579 RepID=A0A934J8A4_9BACL|nr:class I SAM-dependent methyltransferase [Paenibacillus roseus]MBJ6363634.1 class I SAM-dependent methyltransferase [Paenibacillus roseus]